MRIFTIYCILCAYSVCQRLKVYCLYFVAIYELCEVIGRNSYTSPPLNTRYRFFVRKAIYRPYADTENIGNLFYI